MMAHEIKWRVYLKRPGFSLATRSVVITARTEKEAREIVRDCHRYTGDGKVWTIKKLVQI